MTVHFKTASILHLSTECVVCRPESPRICANSFCVNKWFVLRALQYTLRLHTYVCMCYRQKLNISNGRILPMNDTWNFLSCTEHQSMGITYRAKLWSYFRKQFSNSMYRHRFCRENNVRTYCSPIVHMLVLNIKHRYYWTR